MPSISDTTILIARDGMGHADPPLQRELIRKYLTLLLENGMLPGVIALYADGVKLAIEGSPVLGELARLESAGVHLILCLTCLNYYGIKEKVRVGVIGGMGDILAAQVKAAKVITL